MSTSKTPIQSNQPKEINLVDVSTNPPPTLHHPPFIKTRKNTTVSVRRFQTITPGNSGHKNIHKTLSCDSNSIIKNIDIDDNGTINSSSSSSTNTVSLYTDNTPSNAERAAEKIKHQEDIIIKSRSNLQDKQTVRNELMKYNQELTLLQKQSDHNIALNASTTEDTTTIGSVTIDDNIHGETCYYPEMLSISSSHEENEHNQPIVTIENIAKTDELMLLAQLLLEKNTQQTPSVKTEDMNHKLNGLLKTLKEKCSIMLSSNDKLILENKEEEYEEADLLEIMQAHDLLKKKHQQLQEVLALSSESFDQDNNNQNDNNQDDNNEDDRTTIDEYNTEKSVSQVIDKIETKDYDDVVSEESNKTLQTSFNEALVEHEERIRFLEEELSQQKSLNAELTFSNNDLSIKSEELHQTSQKLHLKEQQITTLLKQMHDKDALVSDLQDRLYKQDMIHVEEKTKLSDIISDEKAQQQLLRAENKVLKEQSFDKDRCIDSHLMELKELKQSIAERDDTISKHNSIIKDQDITIATLTKEQDINTSTNVELSSKLQAISDENANLNRRVVELEIQEIEFLELLIEKEQLHIETLKKKEEEMSLHKMEHSILHCLSNEESRINRRDNVVIPSLLSACSSSSSDVELSDHNQIEVYMVENSVKVGNGGPMKKEHEIESLKVTVDRLQRENMQCKLEVSDIQHISTNEICDMRMKCQQLEFTIEELRKEITKINDANENNMHYYILTSKLMLDEKKILSSQYQKEHERLNEQIDGLQQEAKPKNILPSECMNGHEDALREKEDIIVEIKNYLDTLKQTAMSHEQTTDQQIDCVDISREQGKIQKVEELTREISVLQSGINVLETNLLEKENLLESMQQQHETDIEICKSKYEIQISDYTIQLQEKEQELSKVQSEYKLLQGAYVTTKNLHKKMHVELLQYKNGNKCLIDEKESVEAELNKVRKELSGREERLKEKLESSNIRAQLKNSREDRLNAIRAEIELQLAQKNSES